jgi:hypothetical protein
MGNPLVDKRITAPPADEVLLAHCHAILHQALPGLAAPPQTLEIVLTQMVTALIAQMNDTRQAREQKLADDQEPKLPSTCFPVTLLVLMEYLQIKDKQALPDLCNPWSNCTKWQEIQVLCDSFDGFAHSPEAYSSTVPMLD